ncbi:hypothetical protein [Alkalihalobacillus pseudalcaliphilus]|uniref:hypothetical protein n=1 Tax=Alkalihalobacillus pseudalcaliphilus TaxID=79884 RepID=UPI00064D9E61|nr:hypothetical protein [Alkalihalobacillus pseudalcaliphilus]KMK75447.1 hypothetical protein AB990_09045 [Alkalihalobacillus pseudalcaliphilus]
MDEQYAQALAELREGTIDEYRVAKADFLAFRVVLLAQEDAQSFRGNAQIGGDVVYTYEPGWTK